MGFQKNLKRGQPFFPQEMNHNHTMVYAHKKNHILKLVYCVEWREMVSKSKWVCIYLIERHRAIFSFVRRKIKFLGL